MEVEIDIKLENVVCSYPAIDVQSMFIAAFKGDMSESFKDDDLRIKTMNTFNELLDSVAQRAFKLGLDNGKKEFK